MEFSDIENILNETNKVLKDEDQYLIQDHFGFWIEGVFLVSFRQSRKSRYIVFRCTSQ